LLAEQAAKDIVHDAGANIEIGMATVVIMLPNTISSMRKRSCAATMATNSDSALLEVAMWWKVSRSTYCIPTGEEHIGNTMTPNRTEKTMGSITAIHATVMCP